MLCARAYYVGYQERIGHAPCLEYPEAEFWVEARRMVELRRLVVW